MNLCSFSLVKFTFFSQFALLRAKTPTGQLQIKILHCFSFIPLLFVKFRKLQFLTLKILKALSVNFTSYQLCYCVCPPVLVVGCQGNVVLLTGHTPKVWTMTFTLTLTANSVSLYVRGAYLVSPPTVSVLFYCIRYSKDKRCISYVFHKRYAIFSSSLCHVMMICLMDLWPWSSYNILRRFGNPTHREINFSRLCEHWCFPERPWPGKVCLVTRVL